MALGHPPFPRTIIPFPLAFKPEHHGSPPLPIFAAL